MDVPYTRDRSAFIGHVAGWMVVFFAEGVVVFMLAMIFLPGWWKVLGISLPLVLLGWFAWVAHGPMRTRHRLDDEALHIRFGSTSVDIPRSVIAGIEGIDSRKLPAFTPVPVINEDQQAQITFSHMGQVRLTFHEPIFIEIRGQRRQMRSLLFNVDERESLIEELVSGTTGPLKEIDPVLTLPGLTIAPHNEEPALEVLGLTKSFGEKVAVSDLNLNVFRGEIYGFIGPNGAGKSTTISMLVGLMAPTNGVVRIGGHDLALNPVGAKATYGYVPDRPPLYDMLTAREHLEFVSQMRSMDRAEERDRIQSLAELVELARYLNEPVRGYSLGTRRKLSRDGADA